MNTFSLYRKSLSFVTLRVKAEPLREIRISDLP